MSSWHVNQCNLTISYAGKDNVYSSSYPSTFLQLMYVFSYCHMHQACLCTKQKLWALGSCVLILIRFLPLHVLTSIPSLTHYHLASASVLPGDYCQVYEWLPCCSIQQTSVTAQLPNLRSCIQQSWLLCPVLIFHGTAFLWFASYLLGFLCPLILLSTVILPKDISTTWLHTLSPGFHMTIIVPMTCKCMYPAHASPLRWRTKCSVVYSASPHIPHVPQNQRV